MIVVSDTTPLNYLILTEAIHVLPAIFGRVYAPPAVIEELFASEEPGSGSDMGEQPRRMAHRSRTDPCRHLEAWSGRDSGDLTGPRIEIGPGPYR